MPHKVLRPHERMPPAINIISIATFAASLSARALDPVLPHIADEFSVSIATAASFAAVFAFTFAVIQPVLGAAADLFGKARLMIACLVLLGIANILGAISSSFPLLFATRILAGIGSGGVFPVALSLTSDLVAPEKRQRDRADAGWLHDRQSLGRIVFRRDRRLAGLARRFDSARPLGDHGFGCGGGRISRHGADAQ